MPNEAVFLVQVFLSLLAVLLACRMGYAFLVGLIGAQVVLMNLFVLKQMELFGLAVTGGNVLYASIFLTTDIISEHFGRREAHRAVWLGFGVSAFFVCRGASAPVHGAILLLSLAASHAVERAGLGQRDVHRRQAPDAELTAFQCPFGSGDPRPRPPGSLKPKSYLAVTHVRLLHHGRLSRCRPRRAPTNPDRNTSGERHIAPASLRNSPATCLTYSRHQPSQRPLLLTHPP